jgi:hypothetical protein
MHHPWDRPMEVRDDLTYGTTIENMPSQPFSQFNAARNHAEQNKRRAALGKNSTKR